MTGLRENYENGSTAERLMKVAGQPAGFDPLTQFLIQGGLSLASQPATGGGTIADIATAVQKPAADLMTGLGKRDEMRQQLALKGELLDIEQEGAERLKMLDLQNKKAQAEKEAALMLGPGATPEQIQKKAAEILEQRIFGVEKRFQENIKQSEIEAIKQDLGVQSDEAANNFYNFQKQSLPEIRSTYPEYKDLTFVGPVTTNSKTGQYKLKNKRPGIYFDPFLKTVVIIDAAKDVKTFKIDQM